jgi:alpha-1,2-mannosyltransferase
VLTSLAEATAVGSQAALRRWRNRLGRVLSWKRARAYALTLVALYVVAWVDVLLRGSVPLNSSGTPIGGDYIAFHAAGRLVLSGRAAELYDHSAVSQLQQALLGGRIPNFHDAYRNPPFFAALFAPLAGLDLLHGFAVYSLVGLACLGLAIWLLVQELPWLRPRWRGLVVLVLAFPPVYFGLIDGENAVFSLLLYVLIYRALARGNAHAAGVWAALGLFKPQLFFVFPLIFLATRRWRALAWYAAVAAVLLGASLALVGPAGMAAWLRILVEPETGNATVNGWRMASLKSFFDALLPGQTLLSLSLYAASALGFLVVLLRVWSLPVRSLPLLWALTSLVAVLVDPHLVDYDLTVLVPAGVLAGARMPSLRWPMVLAYVLALFRAQAPLGAASLQLTVPLLVLYTLLVLHELGRDVAARPVSARLASSPAATASSLLP